MTLYGAGARRYGRRMPPEPPEAPPALDIEALTADLTAARVALVAVLREMPESQAYRATPRPGWTLKHELALVAAHDAELTHVLVEVRRRPSPLVLDLRRRRSEALRFLVELRLRALVDRLEEEGARLAVALAEHAHVAALPVQVLGLEARSALDLAHAQHQRLRALIEALEGSRR